MQLSNDQRILLHCSLIDGFGPAAARRLIECCRIRDVALSNIYEFSLLGLLALGLTQHQAQLLYDGLRDWSLMNRECALLERHVGTISLITCIDAAYPELLRHIAQPPIVLYWQGAMVDEKALAVVGSRKANRYAINAMESMIPVLVDNGWTIVSGGAYGVDTIAHRGALEYGGRTVVVLGSGLLEQYPLENKVLFQKIVAQGGAIISPFPLETRPSKSTFPARNRIIAGMSRGCFVVQAAEKSGALITAHYALEEGRDIFALPGHIDDPLSVGCHRLIQQGAKLVTSAEDILSEYGEFSANKSEKEEQLSIQDLVDQQIILVCQEPTSLEEIQQSVNLESSVLHQKLFDLSIEGVISQNFMGLWQVASKHTRF